MLIRDIIILGMYEYLLVLLAHMGLERNVALSFSVFRLDHFHRRLGIMSLVYTLRLGVPAVIRIVAISFIEWSLFLVWGGALSWFLQTLNLLFARGVVVCSCLFYCCFGLGPGVLLLDWLVQVGFSWFGHWLFHYLLLVEFFTFWTVALVQNLVLLQGYLLSLFFNKWLFLFGFCHRFLTLVWCCGERSFVLRKRSLVQLLSRLGISCKSLSLLALLILKRLFYKRKQWFRVLSHDERLLSMILLLCFLMLSLHRKIRINRALLNTHLWIFLHKMLNKIIHPHLVYLSWHSSQFCKHRVTFFKFL